MGNQHTDGTAWFSVDQPSCHFSSLGETSIWRTSDANADFEPNAAAPIMRTQNLVHLVGVITGWYKKAPAAL